MQADLKPKISSHLGYPCVGIIDMSPHCGSLPCVCLHLYVYVVCIRMLVWGVCVHVFKCQMLATALLTWLLSTLYTRQDPSSNPELLIQVL